MKGELYFMANRARNTNEANYNRQIRYLRDGVVMLPTLREEKKAMKELKLAKENKTNV